MPSDSDIIRLYRSGAKEEAFNQVVKIYGERLYWHIRRLVLVHEDADDLLQNTFVKAWGAMDSFRGDSGLLTWLWRIATTETLTFLDKKRKTGAFSLAEEPDRAGNLLKTDRNFDGDALQLTLQQAIASLPPRQRVVFTMRYYDETPYEQISKVLGASTGALKASYHHACNKVLEYVKDRIDIDY